MTREKRELLKKESPKKTTFDFFNPFGKKDNSGIEAEMKKLEKNDYVSVGNFIIAKMADRIKAQPNAESNLQALKNTNDAIMFVLMQRDPKVTPSKNQNIDHVLVNGVSMKVGAGKIFRDASLKGFFRDDMSDPGFDFSRNHMYLIDTKLMNAGFKKMETKSFPLIKKEEKKEDDKGTASKPEAPAAIAKEPDVIDAAVIGGRVIVPSQIADKKEEVVPFKVSPPSTANTFILNSGETVEAGNSPIPEEFTDEEKAKLDAVARKVIEYLGPIQMHFQKLPNNIINLSILRANGYTENYPVDIYGLIDGGSKPRMAVRTMFGDLYIPFDEPLCQKALQTRFYACTPEEFNEIVDKYCYTPSMYTVVDFSGIKSDIPDNRNFKKNLAKVLDKLMEKKIEIPRMRVKYTSDNDFRLISDEYVKTPYPEGMKNVKPGFIVKYENGKIKVKE